MRENNGGGVVTYRKEGETRQAEVRKLCGPMLIILEILGQKTRMAFLNSFANEETGETAVLLYVPGTTAFTPTQVEQLKNVGLPMVSLTEWPAESKRRPLIVVPEGMKRAYLAYVIRASEREVMGWIEHTAKLPERKKIATRFERDKYQIMATGELDVVMQPFPAFRKRET